MKKNDTLGALILLLAAAIWGFAFMMQEWAAETLSAFSVLFFRSAIAVVFLVFAVMGFDRVKKSGRRLFSVTHGRFVLDITKREWLGGGLAGVFLTLASLVQQMGITETGGGLAAFITSLYMVFVPLFSVFLGKRVGVKNALCAVFALGGFFLISMSDFTLPGVGDLLVFLSALLFAAQILTIDKMSEGCDGVRFSLVEFITCTVITAPFCFFLEAPSAAAVGAALPYLLFLGILSSGCAYTMQILGQQYMTSPTVAGILMSMENVFALLGGVIFLPETNTLSSVELIGCGVILLSVVLSQLRGKGKKGENTGEKTA